MPKIITSAMRAHLDAETTRLAAIWRITRKDGQRFFFTDHDRDIVFGGDTYRADAGFARTAIRSDAGFAVDNLDRVGVCGECGHEHLRGGSLIAHGGMRPDGIVVASPAFDDDLRLAQRVEDLPIEELVTQARIEALDEAARDGLD